MRTINVDWVEPLKEKGGDFTVAQVSQEVKLPNGVVKTFTALGVTKRDPTTDQPSKAIGNEVAVERAKSRLREKVQKAQEGIRVSLSKQVG